MHEASRSGRMGPDTDYCDESEIARLDAMTRHQQLIDQLPEGYIEYNLRGDMVCFNQAVIEMGGRDREELLNISYRDFMEKEKADRVTEIHKEVYRTGIPVKNFINEILHKDGHKVIVEGFISLIWEKGEAVGFRGIYRDITRRRITEQSLADHQRRLEAIFGSVKDGIIAIDARGQVINANQAVESICGVSAANITGKSFAGTAMSCSQSCIHIIADALSNRTEIQESQIGCRRGERPQQVVALNSSPLIDAEGRSMGAVLVIKDITTVLGLERELKGRYKFQNIIGKSPKMQDLYELLENLASLGTTVLITGESGTGKELVAKALHYAGDRSGKSFVKVNCSALPESLLESELFGHVKGAFTGAIKDRQGRFQAADGGTILLDEIGDISPLIQLKLLRVLQEKEFERVGESTPRRVDVRVIASTNKDLKEKVRNGEFREDLYYRLKVMEIAMPPLRDRIEDLPLLADHFCQALRERYQKPIENVASEVLDLFMNYKWPGNVRELEHVLEHAFVLCSGRTIHLAHLPKEIKEHAEAGRVVPQGSTRRTRHDAQTILAALEKTGWNRSKAAGLLGINRRTIYSKIKQYGLREKR